MAYSVTKPENNNISILLSSLQKFYPMPLWRIQIEIGIYHLSILQTAACVLTSNSQSLARVSAFSRQNYFDCRLPLARWIIHAVLNTTTVTRREVRFLAFQLFSVNIRIGYFRKNSRHFCHFYFVYSDVLFFLCYS